MKPLYQLIYNSAATCTFTNDDLTRLLRAARHNNAKRGVTGMLLFIDGCFFQVLEGPQDVVDNLAEHIQNDPRHSKMTIIVREPIARRTFNDWSMGFTCVARREAESIDGLNDFFAAGKALTQLDNGRAKMLLRAFSEGRWRVQLNAPLISQPGPLEAIPTTPLHQQEAPSTNAKQYTFAFQPVVNMRDHSVVAYEALVRGLGNKPALSVLQSLSGPALWKFDRDARIDAITLAARLGLQGRINLNLLPDSLNSLGGSAMSVL